MYNLVGLCSLVILIVKLLAMVEIIINKKCRGFYKSFRYKKASFVKFIFTGSSYYNQNYICSISSTLKQNLAKTIIIAFRQF